MKIDKSVAVFLFLLFGLLQVTMLAAVALAPSSHPMMISSTKQATFEPASAVATLVGQADLVARAQVVHSTSQWNSNHTLIETEHRLIIRYTMIGKASADLIIHTDGGFLPAEGMGMRASHTATFTPGEEVLVFVQETPSGYRIVGGEIGKFTVVDAQVVNSLYREHLPLSELTTLIVAAAKSQGRSTTLPAAWHSYEPLASPRRVDISKSLQADPKWPGATPKIKVKVNLNSIHIGGQGGSAEQFLTAIQNTLRAWSAVPEAEFTLLYDGATTATSTGFNNLSEILFMKKGANSQVGQAQIWFTANGTIVEADVWLNDDYALDATGNPESNEIDVESATLHEVGHWLPLSHLPNPNAVMYAVLAVGARRIVLGSDDLASFIALYPCPVVPCIDPAYAPSATATPTTTATTIATATATITPTPTLILTDIPNTPTVTPTATLSPNAVTPTPAPGVFLPLITR